MRIFLKCCSNGCNVSNSVSMGRLSHEILTLQWRLMGTEFPIRRWNRGRWRLEPVCQVAVLAQACSWFVPESGYQTTWSTQQPHVKRCQANRLYSHVQPCYGMFLLNWQGPLDTKWNSFNKAAKDKIKIKPLSKTASIHRKTVSETDAIIVWKRS